MQIDIKTSSVKPLRNTYAYIEKRFGDKPASRYQEATYDIQEEINFHLQIINTLKCIFSMGLRNDCLIKFLKYFCIA
ncbi:hypothetical protein SNB68_07245 [Escherichia coli]|nr:hypothetical protein [Escherichia coli]